MTRQTPETNDQLAAKRVVAQLDTDVANLNSVERAKLAAARHNALARAPRRRFELNAWHGAAATAVLVLAVSVTLLQDRTQPTETARVVAAPSTADALFNDLPLLATGDEVEFYRDLEFLMWLETQGENAT